MPATIAPPNASPDAPHAATASLTAEQLADRIISINPSATHEFLGQFAETPLRHYLDHLLTAQHPRGRESRWTPPTADRSIVIAAW